MSWQLDKLHIDFKSGYSFNNSKDRYEGEIRFMNKEGESFTFNLSEERCTQYLQLIAGDIVTAATQLGHKVKTSIEQQLTPAKK